MPNDCKVYLRSGWQAVILRNWLEHIHTLKLRYQYKLAKLLYFKGSTEGRNTVNEIYELFFKPREEPSQQDIQELIEEYERIFGINNG